MFDLESDAGETKNLWNEPDAQDIAKALLKELLTFHLESTMKTRNLRRLTVSPKQIWQFKSLFLGYSDKENISKGCCVLKEPRRLNAKIDFVDLVAADTTRPKTVPIPETRC